MLLGAEAARLFAGARAIVFGAGGVGGWCAEALVRTGMRRIAIVDFDRVCESNVNRQAAAVSSSVGEIKVDALARRLRDINPSAEIDPVCKRFTAETASGFNLASFDFVFDAIDSVSDKAELVCRALECPGVSFFSSMGAALKLDPFRIRASDFKKVQGDGLARALRARFKKTGRFPCRGFKCVWSDEPRAADACIMPDGTRVNGTAVHVVAAFGFALASLAVRETVLRAKGGASVSS